MRVCFVGTPQGPGGALGNPGLRGEPGPVGVSVEAQRTFIVLFFFFF